MKNQEQVQWSVLPDNAEVLHSDLKIRSGIPQECGRSVVVVGSCVGQGVNLLLQSSWNVEDLS